MAVRKKMLAFGPVPSRRLGRSLGINNIPPKSCTYSCVYCQLGGTPDIRVERRAFHDVDKITGDTVQKLRDAKERREHVDYLTFVSDGEPTLDVNLGAEIESLKSTGVKIAVITNSSLLFRQDVRDALHGADLVSCKVDAVNDENWRRINRPHRQLRLEKILDGLKEFASGFKGELLTETMLVHGVNDDAEELGKIACFIASLAPEKSYISIPTRPPAGKWVKPPGEGVLNLAYQLFIENSIDVEYLIGYEGDAFAFSGNVEEDLLGITSVHPMRSDAVNEFLSGAGSDWSVIEKLIKNDELREVEYEHNKFYIRKLKDL